MIIPKEERLTYTKFTAEEKIKCMDKMIKYIKENSNEIYNKDNPSDVYNNCRVMASTTLFDFICDHIKEN